MDRLAALSFTSGEGAAAFAAGELYSLDQARTLEGVVTVGVPACPYDPGFLALREAPLLMRVVRSFDRPPDALLVRGHGYAHPRRFGLASHLGRLLDRPSVGCAEDVLVGEHGEPGEQPGSLTDLWDDEPVGYACRSHPEGNPIYLSPGHGIARERVPSLVVPLLDGRSKLPAPLRRARRRAVEQRRRLGRLVDPFRSRGIRVLMVGGGLRDLLSGRSPRDHDLLVEALPSSAGDELAERLQGRLFALDEDRGIHRCAGDRGTVDITVLDGESVEENLRRRDFTVNAMALDPEAGRWWDPTGGFSDVRRSRLRPCRSDGIRRDPLRVLRAYRHERRYGLTPTTPLRETLAAAAGGLETISEERIVEELFRLIGAPDPARGLERMAGDGLFARVEAFREEAPREVGILDEWRPALRNHDLLRGTVHGGVSLMRALMAARVVLPGGDRSWPLHRRVRRITDASARPPGGKPGEAVLRAPRDRLLGRMLGRGLHEAWSMEQTGEVVARLGQYLVRRRELEKRVARDTQDPGRIPERKEAVLGDRLPRVWAVLLSPVL